MCTILAMGLIRKGDDDLHHSDSSHRLVSPPGADEERWQRRMDAHRERHRNGETAQARPSPRDGTTPRTTGRGLPRSTR